MNTCLIFLYWVTHFSEVFKTRRWNDIDSFRQSQSPAMQLLVDQIPSFCLSSRAANTQRQYRYVFNAFCKWCLSINFSNTLPASVISVASYLVYLTNIGKSTSSINEAFYAISWAHRLAGVENPCKSDLVISVKEGSLRSVGHIVVKNLYHQKFCIKLLCFMVTINLILKMLE